MTDEPRELAAQDIEWVVDLAARRRQRIAGFAPRFWRPAPDARRVHSEWIGELIRSPDVVSLRTDRGFAIAAPNGNRLVVDDMAVDDAFWSTDGARLLGEVARRGPLRVVCPVPEPLRRQAVSELGLSVVETWWHRDLDPNPAPAESPLGDQPPVPAESLLGAEGVRLVPAPPIYAPGGPVLLVNAVASAAALAELEQAASRRGAVVAVVSQRPDAQHRDDQHRDDQPTADRPTVDGSTAVLLRAAGYRPTTEFFERLASGT
ncbi:hypothetical protein OG394_19810 [Kribbella sp. NBC_01245]|uniref:hypothetical protein n=1 Tax=Kribbella sp. NBC_01245 TaxID=2903578 RepID=UPI002E2E3F21|nr:hypothetical protein [Kribbella sp. NBC_01245]